MVCNNYNTIYHAQIVILYTSKVLSIVLPSNLNGEVIAHTKTLVQCQMHGCLSHSFV